MALNIEAKQAIIAEVAEVAAKAHSAVAAEYRGLTVGEMTELRAKARQSDVYVRVVKNTLARRAIQGTSFECMQQGLTGPLVLAFSKEDPGAAARVISEFVKGHNKMVVRLVSLGGKVYEPSEIDRVAKMPTKEQAISMLMGVMKQPVEKLARSLKEVPGKLVRAVAAVRDQKQSA